MDDEVPLISRLLSRAETLAHLSQSNDAALMREAVEELERRAKGWSEAFDLGHYHQTEHYAKRDALEAIARAALEGARSATAHSGLSTDTGEN